MKSKFNMLYESVMSNLIKESIEFDFINTDECGPEHILVVQKTDVYAHAMTEEDVKTLGKMSSREVEYSDADKKVGNFICTNKGLSEDDGKFWIVPAAKFESKYEPADEETITENFGGLELTFKHYNAKGDETSKCFKLPADTPKDMQINGNKFIPGDFVFIEKNGDLDPYARSASLMQKQYKLVKRASEKADEDLVKQYNELIQQ
jgi:hypothetical protein